MAYIHTELPLETVRKHHMLYVEQNMGRAMQNFPLLIDKSIELLQKYVDHAQRDSHRFYHAHWDLAQALLASAMMKFDAKTDETAAKKVLDEVQHMVCRIDKAVRDAENCKRDFLPISEPPLDTEYPIISLVKSQLTMFKLEIKSRTREKGNKKGGKAGIIKCWGCDNEGKLVCSRCKTARFCSAECQKKAWKQHKPDCNKISGLDK